MTAFSTAMRSSTRRILPARSTRWPSSAYAWSRALRARFRSGTRAAPWMVALWWGGGGEGAGRVSMCVSELFSSIQPTKHDMVYV